jgi:MOSC domain-containing protein YiiM
VPEGNRVESVAVPALRLDFEGPAGDRHYGITRHAGAREPWHPRDTVISNIRQVSVLSVEEMAVVAARLGIPELKAEWIGGTILIGGVPRLSYLPAGTRLFFAGGASLLITEQNGPCRIAGRAIAAHFPERPELELEFPKQAKGLRGVVGAVERPGTVTPGSAVEVRVPEQWIYRA